MEKQTFSDINKKKGTVGAKVVEVFYGKELAKIHTVTKIISKGRSGTRIYFDSGGYGNSSNFKIVEEQGA